MADQYAATDRRTGLEVTVTGTFPDDPEDRVRIARTSTLFTRLMSTILALEDATPRREGFRAVETQLEVADALLRHDHEEVQRLLRETLHSLGITEDRLGELEQELRRHLGDALEQPPYDPGPEDDIPLDDRGLHDVDREAKDVDDEDGTPA